jgi:hypothetical protein
MKKNIRNIALLDIGGNCGGINKMPLAKCKEILGSRAAKYSDEQILKIMDWFYELAAMAHEEYFTNLDKPNTIIPITKQPKDTDNEERYYLRAG